MKRVKAIKEKNPIKKMLRVHKDYCKMNEYSLMEHRDCTCGRDAALQLYEDIEEFLLDLDTQIEKCGIYETQRELGRIIERLV